MEKATRTGGEEMEKKILLEVLNPRGEMEIVYHKPAPRLPDLKGKTIGLIDNKKSGGREFLNIIRSLIEKNFEGVEFVELSKNYGERHRIKGFREALRGVDAAVYSTGD
jgi:hypothetical protein